MKLVRLGLAFASLFWLFAIGAVESRATCRAAPPQLLTGQAATRLLVDRYNTLVAQDPYLLADDTAVRWQTLADDLARDRHAPAELVVRTRMMLANARRGDAVMAPNLADAQAALALAEANGIRAGSLHAALLTTLAGRETDSGKVMDAVRHADAALAETAQVDGEDSWTYGNAANNAAEAHFANGEYLAAERLAGTAEKLAIACLPAANSIIGNLIQSHAATLSTIGRTDEALAAGERAVAWDAEHLPESDPALANGLEDLGFTLRNANRLREAEAVTRRALDLQTRYRPNDAFERASATGKLGNILVGEGKYREAGSIFAAAEALYAQTHNLSNPLAGSGELRRAADAAQEQGKLSEALDLRRQAVALIESRVPPHHPELARARIEEATTLVVAGRAKEALAIAEPAVAILRAGAPTGDFKRMGAEIAYGAIAGAAGVDPARAYASVKPAARQMEAILLDSATSRGDLIRFAPTFTTSFAAVTRLALAAHDEEGAFHALQLANLSDIALVDADATARATAADPHIRDRIDQLAALTRHRHEIDRERLDALANGDAAKVLADNAAIQRNDELTATTTKALDAAFPAYHLLGRPVPTRLDQVRAGLGAGDVVLAPLLRPEETLVVAITRHGLQWTSVAATRAAVIALIARVRASIDASREDAHRTFDTADAGDLGAILLPPMLAATIKAHRHLVYYASGALASVQPALLVTDVVRRSAAPAWLVRSHSISIATDLRARTDIARPLRDEFLGIGAPALGGRPLTMAMRGIEVKLGEFGKAGVAALSQLPNAERELSAMGALFPADRRRILLGAAATKTALAALPLNHYGVIAFATHGLLADALPGLTQPALVLTPDGPAGDGLLTSGDIAALHLDADWVILSACDTAAGVDPQGGSYSGLASAFIQAGARALLVSHWPVRDDAAERITVATLAATRRGMDRPAALRQAMLTLMRDPKVPGATNPAIWAPFVLVDR